MSQIIQQIDHLTFINRFHKPNSTTGQELVSYSDYVIIGKKRGWG